MIYKPATLTVTPLVVWHTELISIQGWSHVGLHCKKSWSAVPAPGGPAAYGLTGGAWPRGLDMCLSGQSPNRETPYYCLWASLLFTEAIYTRRIKAGSKHTPCRTIVSENNTLPRQKLWKTYPWVRHTRSTQSIARAPGPLLRENGELQKWGNKP